MAVESMSTFGNTIIVKKPKGVGLKHKMTNGTDIKPGHLVTATGMTDPDVDLIDAADEVAEGVVTLSGNPGQDIDTAFGDSVAVTIAPCGSGIVVRAWLAASQGALKRGTRLLSNGDGTLKIITTPTSYAEVESILQEFVGLLYEDMPNSADTQVCEIQLSW